MHRYSQIPEYDRESSPKKEVEYNHRPFYIISVVAVVTILTFICVSAIGPITTDNDVVSDFVATNDVGTEALASSITLYRDGYTVLPHFDSLADTNYLQYQFLSPYSAIVEPHAPMKLSVADKEYNPDYVYDWTLCNTDQVCEGGYISGSETTSATTSCSPFDVFSLTVTEANSNGVPLRSTTVNVMCMYVRREIGSLTESDLSETMDAMYTLWSTQETDGQTLYGDNYHSASYFLEAHHFNAATQSSDHIHEGLGFVTQHIKFSNMFELSMQSVNPKVTLPYWEYTKDFESGKTIFDSIMFTERTFGSLKEPKSNSKGFTYNDDLIYDGAIQDGRWKMAKTDTNVKFSDIPNAYNLMRAPWNMNPSPYISRYTTTESVMPACADYLSLFTTASTEMVDFLDLVQRGSHAPIHASIGNTFGCDIIDELTSSGSGIVADDKQAKLCRNWSFYMKDLYRTNYLKPVTGCSTENFDASSNELTCAYECNEDQADTFIDALKDKLSKNEYLTSESTENYSKMKDFICTGNGYKIIVGAHMESASAADPSFWPIHPTQERLLHVFLLASNIQQWKWPTNSEVDYICGTAECYDDETDTYGYFDSCCYGHYENDQLLDYIKGDDKSYIGATNKDTLAASNPLLDTYSVPYIYDTFQFDHCDDTGEIDGGLDGFIKYTFTISQV